MPAVLFEVFVSAYLSGNNVKCCSHQELTGINYSNVCEKVNAMYFLQLQKKMNYLVNYLAFTWKHEIVSMNFWLRLWHEYAHAYSIRHFHNLNAVTNGTFASVMFQIQLVPLKIRFPRLPFSNAVFCTKAFIVQL